MKVYFTLYRVDALKGIELHRHKHGHRHEPTQDDRIKPKPGTYENKLVAKYGTNFRYLGKSEEWARQSDSGHFNSHTKI